MTDEELLDIVDEGGRALGYARPRAEVHRLGLWHETVHVWIVDSRGMILFQKRSSSKESFPGLWDVSAAGHIVSGETAANAAIRETRQELGLDVTERELRFLFALRSSSVQNDGVFVDNEFNLVHLVRKDVPAAGLRLQKAEVEAARFFHHREIAKIASRNDPAFAPHPEEYAALLAHFSGR
jgi:isopentenyl-diphosphate Delta-isomerase